MMRFFIFSIFSILMVFGISHNAFAQTQDELKGEQNHIQNLQCKEGRIAIVNNVGNAVLCVKESSIERFTKSGWSLVNTVVPNEISVMILNLFERPSSPGIYTVIFRTCADSQSIRTPQVIASSDVEVKVFNMIKNIEPHSCYNSATIIKSNNFETIVVKINNQNNSNQKIVELEQKISKLKYELQKQNSLLTQLINESATSDKSNNILQIYEVTDKVQHLRAELSDARSEYYNLLYLKYSR